MDELEKILSAGWGIQQARLERIDSGHTNESFLVTDAGRRYVLRRSWAGKGARQVQREERVLRHLAGGAVPHLRPAADGALHVRADGRWLHLFDHLDGVPGNDLPSRLPLAAAASTRLAELHQKLRGFDGEAAPAAASLESRYRRVRARGARGLAPRYADEVAEVLSRIKALLAALPPLLLGPAQWLHGDYHPGNLLCAGGRIAVIDFDDTGWGAAALELGCALFAMSRRDAPEDRFHFDAELWEAGLAAYGRADPDTAARCGGAPRGVLLRLFCADQVLIHLEAAQRGLWRLGPGIGFLPCWRELQRSGSSQR